MKRSLRSNRTGNLMTVAGLGLGGYLLYNIFKNKAQAAPAGAIPVTGPAGNLVSVYTPSALNASVPGVSFAPSTLQPGILASTLTAVPALTGAQVGQAGSFWSTLQPVQPLDSGYIVFPSGTQTAAAAMGGGNTAMDGNGNYYVLWGAQVYQLGAQDSAGNWPALPVNASGAGTGTPSGVLMSSGSPGLPSSWFGL